MKIIRFWFSGKEAYGVLDGDQVKCIQGSPFQAIAFSGEIYSIDEVKLLAPVKPGKIIAAGLNYRSHARELKMALPEEPLIFLKPPSSIINPFDTIVRPSQSRQVDYEAELAVVIGRACKNVSEDMADSVILGYTCLNDVTARDIQARESQWTRAKGFDTFCPIGPFIETEYNWRGKRIRALLNDEVRQDATTDDFIHPVERLLSFISSVMTLDPGDVIATGTPGGIGPMAAKDTIKIEIEGIGVLQNSVTDQKA